MKIYLCGPCDTTNRTTMVKAANILREYDYDVYCPWVMKIPEAWDMPQEVWAQKVFDNDIIALQSCDCLVMISFGRESTAGSNWEQGYAYGIGKPVYVIQITESPTSLMTYCGCNFFISSYNWKLKEDLEWVAKHIREKNIGYYQKECSTILT